MTQNVKNGTQTETDVDAVVLALGSCSDTALTEAMKADRVIVMHEGKIAFQGTPKEVFSRVDELEKLGLEAPLAAKFAFELRKSGAKIPDGIITNEELAEALA